MMFERERKKRIELYETLNVLVSELQFDKNARENVEVEARNLRRM